MPASRKQRQRLVADLRPQRRVEGGECLVQQHELGRGRQRPGQRHPLLLAAGKGVGIGCGRTPACSPPPVARQPADPGPADPGPSGRRPRSRRRADAGTARNPGTSARPAAAPAAGCAQARPASGHSARHARSGVAPGRQSAAAWCVLPQPDGPTRQWTSPGVRPPSVDAVYAPAGHRSVRQRARPTCGQRQYARAHGHPREERITLAVARRIEK